MTLVAMAVRMGIRFGRSVVEFESWLRGERERMKERRGGDWGGGGDKGCVMVPRSVGFERDSGEGGRRRRRWFR